MNYSSHYNLNLAEGTDLVNPLTVDVPNYQAIDSAMYANEQAGVGTATELKSGTIHAITRANQNRDVFKFTASSIFNTGDTFTVDGSTVTALYPDQSSLKDRCFIVGSEVLCLLNGLQLTVLATYFPEASTVTFNDANVPYTANNVQSAIEHISFASGQEYTPGISVKDMLDYSIQSTAHGTLIRLGHLRMFLVDLGTSSIQNDTTYTWTGEIPLADAPTTVSLFGQALDSNSGVRLNISGGIVSNGGVVYRTSGGTDGNYYLRMWAFWVI